MTTCHHCDGSGFRTDTAGVSHPCWACDSLGVVTLTAEQYDTLHRARRWQLVGVMVSLLGALLGAYAVGLTPAFNGLGLLAVLVILAGGAIAVAATIHADHTTKGA